MKHLKKCIIIGIILLPSLLPACTRAPEIVSESGSIQSQSEPIISEGIKSSQISSIESSASSQSSEPEELAHPYKWNRYSSWTPDGNYFVCIDNNGFDLYNTDNQLEKHTDFFLKGEIYVGNEGIYFFPDAPSREEWDDKPGSFWQAGDEILLSGFTYIDWDGNILIQRPSTEIQTDEMKYYLENKEVTPMIGYVEKILLDGDMFLFMLYDDMADPYFVHYIPSQNKFIHLGRQNVNHNSVKTPKGVFWVSWKNKKRYLQLTGTDGTIPLLADRSINYVYANNEIVVVVLDEADQTGWDSILYAPLDTLQFKKIGQIDMFIWPFPDQVQLVGPYIVFEDFTGGAEYSESALIAYDTQTDESWKVKGDLNDELLRGARIKNGELEVLFDKIVATKDKIKFYSDEEYEVHRDSINPPKTHCVYFSEDHSTFTIKPYLGWED